MVGGRIELSDPAPDRLSQAILALAAKLGLNPKTTSVKSAPDVIFGAESEGKEMLTLLHDQGARRLASEHQGPTPLRWTILPDEDARPARSGDRLKCLKFIRSSLTERRC